jgi:hypothetical protein
MPAAEELLVAEVMHSRRCFKQCPQVLVRRLRSCARCDMREGGVMTVVTRHQRSRLAKFA